MNHPSNEQWMSFLYDELPAAERAGCNTHLEQCAECRARVDAWNATRTDLDQWRLTPARTRGRPVHAALQWAAAAAVLLCVGFAAGRGFAKPDLDQIRAGLEPALRSQLRQEFEAVLRAEINKSAEQTLAASNRETHELLGAFEAVVDRNRALDNRATLAAINRVGEQRLADYASLKKELDTVALYSEAGVRQTREQLVQLAGYNPASPVSSIP